MTGVKTGLHRHGRDERVAASAPRRAQGAPTDGAARGECRFLGSETRLLQGLRLREPDAYAVLVRAYGPAMLFTARRYVRSEADAEDVVQSAFVLVVRFLPAFAGSSRLATWLHRIVVNCALMLLRQRRRHPEVRLDSLPHESGIEPRLPRDAAPTVADALARREERAGLHAALEQLPETQRAALQLYALNGQTLADTVRLLDIPYAIAKRRVSGGRAALRALRWPACRPAGARSLAP